MKKILIHGSGHRAASWQETVSHMAAGQDVLCPELSSLLGTKEASYENLYASFAEYCGGIDGQLHLCGISLGGILALQYVLDFPDKVKTLAIIGTPHKVPRLLFGIQNIIFRLLPESSFKNTAFSKRDTFILGNSMKTLDFSGRAENIRCPVLVICGEKDRANIKSAYYFSEAIPQADLKIIRNAGHIINEEAPEALAELLDSYYRETP